jgi:hypothetical protein
MPQSPRRVWVVVPLLSTLLVAAAVAQPTAPLFPEETRISTWTLEAGERSGPVESSTDRGFELGPAIGRSDLVLAVGGPSVRPQSPNFPTPGDS